MQRVLPVFLVLSMLAALSVKAQVKDSTVTAIYTDYKSYWSTSTTSNSNIRPDTSHNLLAFTFRGKTYSTGVNNAVLNTQLGNSNYSSQVYKAFPVRNIESTVKAGGATNLAFALKNDGDSTKAAYKIPYPTIHIDDVLTDGINGLDLGTGVTNLPKGGHISFAIKNLNPTKALDAVPDLVFTQIAEPTTNQPDTIFFYDANNNIVGNKKLVYWNSVQKLGTYKLDLYTLTPNMPCNTSIMNGLFEQNGTRDIRMVAFLMTEFGITSSDLAAKVKGVQINPCGSSDQAFIAYNTSTINLDVPVITSQPVTQVLCNASNTSATFSVSATSSSELTYQWKKNGEEIFGATSSSYTDSNLTFSDTTNVYSVMVSNIIGSITSSNASLKYIFLSKPLPAVQTLATGNATSFDAKTSVIIKSWQWQKDGTSISGAVTAGYAKSVVNAADSGSYTVVVRYDGGTCTSEAAVLKTSIVLYSKATGNMNTPATWGVATDGSGSTPVDFTREEHTFVVANRASLETVTDFSIAGTLDLAGGKVTITPGTTLNAGRIIRSKAAGVIASSATSNLTVHGIAATAYAGASDLYFDKTSNTIKNIITAAHTVTLHTALNITSGKDYGTLQVNSGIFNTSDSLILKSDSLGTAGIAKSSGTISGKVTIEKWMHARRAWRYMGAPVSDVNAPAINAAWQEGGASSAANPNPGYGTHITGGSEANGFDRSPTNNASLKYINADGSWAGLANTNKTPVTQYPAYMLFVRGDRSYNILSTTDKTTPTTTVLRVTGNLYQGTLAAKTVSANGFTMVVNPYASPVNFTKVLSASKNVKKRIYVWDPTLAGAKGVGAWVIVDGTTGTYKTTPPSRYVSTVLQAGQGFIIESADGSSNGALVINEDEKDFSVTTTSSDREAAATTDTSLEVNLKLFNSDNTTAIADGILYNFGARNSDSLDGNDAVKMYNTAQNLAVAEGSNAFAIDSRTAPKDGDSLRLKISGISAASYQLEFVPSSLKNKTLALYDKYLNTFSAISATDTTHITFSVLSNVAASKAADRFTIVAQKSAVQTLPTVTPQLTFTKIRTYTSNKAVNVEFAVQNESAVLYYQVQKSADGISFSTAGTVAATGTGIYTYTDAAAGSSTAYYRIKSVGKDGSSKYSPVVSSQPESTNGSSAVGSAVSVYPSPLTGTAFTVTLSDLAAGTYTLNVVNNNGTTVFSKAITHTGGTASQKVIMNKSLTAGIYYINITAAAKTVSTTKITAL